MPNFCCPQVAQLIAKLEKKKLEAVATERFEYAKKIKSAIGEDKIFQRSNILANCKIISSTLMEQKSKPAVDEDDKY